MLVKCGVCGGHVPEEVAVDLPESGERFCSLACAMQTAPEGRAAGLPELPRRILVAVDGSGPSLRATRTAVAFARANDAALVLLHAIDPALLRGPGASEREKALRAEAEAQLERCRRLCNAAGLPASLVVEVESPARAVIAAAAGADLVVMGSRGLGAVSGQSVGSLSQRVLAETRTPLLVIH